jgi:hypothetical protein
MWIIGTLYVVTGLTGVLYLLGWNKSDSGGSGGKVANSSWFDPKLL